MINKNVKTIQARPFVKWAGGKTRLIDQILYYFPASFNNYYEPFLGGGSLYFSISPQNGRLNDLNSTLIFVYRTIRDNCLLIINDLLDLQAEYYALESLDTKAAYYYERRSEFNSMHSQTVRKASLFIFLNKTGFNGMYRENSKGEYNIPFGKHSKPLICDAVNLERVSNVLKEIDITNGHYHEAIRDAKAGDFVYLDPPYAPLNPTSSFTQYQAGGFGEDDQIQLRNVFMELSQRGCLVMMSNSTSPLVEELYKDFYFNTISAARVINAQGMKRGKINEYIITNYNPDVGKYLSSRKKSE
ncbi:MAG: DNA adenine methylase [Candidatus Microsaccharimonas sp.]